MTEKECIEPKREQILNKKELRPCLKSNPLKSLNKTQIQGGTLDLQYRKDGVVGKSQSSKIEIPLGIRPHIYTTVPFLTPVDQSKVLKEEIEFLDTKIKNFKKAKKLISKKIKEIERKIEDD